MNNYPYLPEGRTIKYVSIENIFMREAMELRNNYSTDSNHPTGAVIVLNNKIIGRGTNQSALKNRILLNFHRDYVCIRKILKIKSGEKYWLCPGCASPRHHAEYRAIKDAINNNNFTSGADLYLYGHWWCCNSCWDSMIDVGIREVYLVDEAEKLFKK